MDLSIKEKEKYVLKLRDEHQTYRDITHELLISPREISKILKKAKSSLILIFIYNPPIRKISYLYS